jgi:hypothetical protein
MTQRSTYKSKERQKDERKLGNEKFIVQLSRSHLQIEFYRFYCRSIKNF